MLKICWNHITLVSNWVVIAVCLVKTQHTLIAVWGEGPGTGSPHQCHTQGAGTPRPGSWWRYCVQESSLVCWPCLAEPCQTATGKTWERNWSSLSQRGIQMEPGTSRLLIPGSADGSWLVWRRTWKECSEWKSSCVWVWTAGRQRLWQLCRWRPSATETRPGNMWRDCSDGGCQTSPPKLQ